MKWLCLTLVCFGSLSAVEFTAEIELPKKKFPLTENVPVKLTLTYPKGWDVDPKALQRNLLQSSSFGIAPFILETFGRDQVVEGDTITDTLTFILEPQTLGKKNLTFWKIPFKAPSGQTAPSLFSDWVEVEILEPKKELQEPLVAPLMHLSLHLPIDLTPENRILLAQLERKEPLRNRDLFSDRSFAWLGWLALLCGLLFLWRSRPQKTQDMREKEKQAARLQLQKSLTKLQEDIQKGDLTDFYTQLANHLRLFYGQFYGKRIDALTTEEFLQQSPPGIRATLQEILTIGDEVRFGHLPSSKENAQKALNLALKELSFSG